MNCLNCKYDNHNLATYCSNCGHKINNEKVGDYNVSIKSISIFFFTLLAYIGILNFSNFNDSYESVLFADSVFGIIIIVFFWYNYKTTIRLFNLKKKSLSTIFKIIIIAPLVALVVYYIAQFFNQSVFDNSENTYYNQFIASPAPLFLSILSIGVMPAVFEEIAFRGIMFNELLKIMGLKPTIFVTSILFTILHLSLISVLWIFPGGLLLGYFRAKYNTLFYSILTHFIYNSSIVLIQFALS